MSQVAEYFLNSHSLECILQWTECYILQKAGIENEVSPVSTWQSLRACMTSTYTIDFRLGVTAKFTLSLIRITVFIIKLAVFQSMF